MDLRHRCPECCTALGYLDDILRFDMERTSDFSRWYRLLHPWRWHAIRVRADYAADLIDESGK